MEDNSALTGHKLLSRGSRMPLLGFCFFKFKEAQNVQITSFWDRYAREDLCKVNWLSHKLCLRFAKTLNPCLLYLSLDSSGLLVCLNSIANTGPPSE